MLATVQRLQEVNCFLKHKVRRKTALQMDWHMYSRKFSDFSCKIRAWQVEELAMKNPEEGNC